MHGHRMGQIYICSVQSWNLVTPKVLCWASLVLSGKEFTCNVGAAGLMDYTLLLSRCSRVRLCATP